jgi:hypothetical protein
MGHVVLVQRFRQSVFPEEKELGCMYLDEIRSKSHQTAQKNPSYLYLSARDAYIRATAGFEKRSGLG